MRVILIAILLFLPVAGSAADELIHNANGYAWRSLPVIPAFSALVNELVS